MKRPLEQDYTSLTAYTRALEQFCDALAQPEQEPVAWRYRAATFWNRDVHWRYLETLEGTEGLQGLKLLYTTPPQRTWVGLKEEEQSFVYDQVKQIVDSKPFWVRFADAIEAKLKDKNHEHRG
jgi:hypothetical protein